MAQPVRTYPDQRTGEATRARILAAAAALFAEHGFDATTVRTIASHAGITDGALYYHFASKREVLNALWQIPPRPPALALGRLTPSRADLIRHAERRFNAWVDSVGLMRILFQQSLEGDRLAIAFRRSVIAGYLDAMIPSFAAVYGERAPRIAEAQLHTLTGLVTDTMLRYGPAFREVAGQESFRRRLRRLLDRALPYPGVLQEQ